METPRILLAVLAGLVAAFAGSTLGLYAVGDPRGSRMFTERLSPSWGLGSATPTNSDTATPPTSPATDAEQPTDPQTAPEPQEQQQPQQQ